jgi:hypothetical protein
MKFVKQNILVNVAGRACLSDIGFAAVAHNGELKFSWDKVGAPALRRMAPELFKNGKTSKKSDMFTYGFVAAEVCPPNVAFCHRNQPHPDIFGRVLVGGDSCEGSEVPNYQWRAPT